MKLLLELTLHLSKGGRVTIFTMKLLLELTLLIFLLYYKTTNISGKK